MPSASETLDLTSRLLVSTPAMSDPRFLQSVIYLCAHGPDGAFGLVVNREARGVTLEQVFEQIGIDPLDPARVRTVQAGGPVEPQRGFVLYRPAEGMAEPAAPNEVQHLPDGLALSASTNVLKEIAAGTGPRDWILALGYAGWGPGQLEAELAQNAWLVAQGDPRLVFAEDNGASRWSRAVRSMGIDPASLSGTAGHA